MSPVEKYPSLSKVRPFYLFHLNILKIKKEILFLVHFECRVFLKLVSTYGNISPTVLSFSFIIIIFQQK